MAKAEGQRASGTRPGRRALSAGLLALLMIMPSRAEMPAEAQLRERVQETIKAAPTLDAIIAHRFFEIPVADQRRLNISLEQYRTFYAEPIAGWLERHRPYIETELQRRFDNLTYEMLAARRAQGQAIAYCSWIPASRIDGLVPKATDFARSFRASCRRLALAAIERLAFEKITRIDASLPAIQALRDDLPRWLVADLASAIEGGPNFDGVTFDLTYRAKAEERLNAMIPAMIETIRRHFTQAEGPAFPLPHPAALCRDLLKGAFRLSGFGRKAGEALKEACLAESGNWAWRFESRIAAGLQQAIEKDRKVRLLASARLLCQDASARIIGDGALLDARLRDDLARQCASLGEQEEQHLIALHLDRIVSHTPLGGSAIETLRKTRWLTVEPDQLRPFLDPRASSDPGFMHRLMSQLEARFAPLREEVVSAVQNDIRSIFQAATTSRQSFDQARMICADLQPLVTAAPANAKMMATGIISTCRQQQEKLFGGMVEKALASSGVAQLDGQTLVVGSFAFVPKSLVTASALSGRLIRFSRGWWGQDVRVVVTSMFGGKAQIEGRFRAGSTPGQLAILGVDAIPGYSADPIEVANCLFIFPDRDNQIAAAILTNMRNLLDGLVAAFVHEVARERCDKALGEYFAP